MKIAIQGHRTRGQEVIKILENIGGINSNSFYGDDFSQYYYIITENRVIAKSYKESLTSQYKLYTLEEFEKEFPFKVGDKVIFKNKYYTNPPIYTITGLEFYKNKLCYLLDNLGLPFSASLLELHKSMKEERNITLTLEKAKEWYNKGGELKEIALQAFTERELNPLPKSWEEYCKENKVPINIFGPCLPIKYIALWKLEQLRDCYRQGWKPDWKSSEIKYCFVGKRNTIELMIFNTNRAFLSFQSREVALEFLENFDPLIKEAGDLI